MIAMACKVVSTACALMVFCACSGHRMPFTSTLDDRFDCVDMDGQKEWRGKVKDLVITGKQRIATESDGKRLVIQEWLIDGGKVASAMIYDAKNFNLALMPGAKIKLDAVRRGDSDLFAVYLDGIHGPVLQLGWRGNDLVPVQVNE